MFKKKTDRKKVNDERKVKILSQNRLGTANCSPTSGFSVAWQGSALCNSHRSAEVADELPPPCHPTVCLPGEERLPDLPHGELSRAT